jgi:hypothetical protein
VRDLGVISNDLHALEKWIGRLRETHGYDVILLATPKAFASRELWADTATADGSPNVNQIVQKFVAAECRNQHATGVRSPEPRTRSRRSLKRVNYSALCQGK